MPTIPIESAEYETVESLTKIAGPIGTGVTILRFIYEFGKTSPIDRAIADIRREIAQIKVQLEELSGRLDTVTQRIVKAENLARIRALQEHVIRLSVLGVQIETSPGDRARAREAATEALARADTFLTDEDLWLWSDVRIVTPHDVDGHPTGPTRVEPVEPDFKTSLALPVYSMALTIWVAAMLVETGSDKAQVQARYGEALDRHIRAVTVRSDWRDDGAAAVTIAEKIRSRITCQPIAGSKFAQNGVCSFSVQCTNTISRTRRVVREFDVTMPDSGPAVLCTINPEVVLQDERELEEQDPAIAMLSLWDEMLRSVAASGHLPAEQFIGVFPTWTAAFVGMYGVDRDLNMDYFTQVLPGDGNWTGPLRVGTGWGFEAILPGGTSAVLAKRPDGTWLWYWHGGSEQTPPTDRWTGPNEIGRSDNSDPAQTRWLHFGAGYGVVYGIVLSDTSGAWTVGDLYWNRLNGYQSGQGPFQTPRRVGNGWLGLSNVCSAGEGVIYGVRSTGVLRWYQHTGWGLGADTWAEPRDLNTNVNWSQYERIVSGGEGVLYGVLANGSMHCYRHLGWRNGDDRLEGPVSAGSSWRFYRPLFAWLPGAVDLGVH